MYAHKIECALAELAGTVTEEQWEKINAARTELSDAAEGVRVLERHLHVNRPMHRKPRRTHARKGGRR